MLIQSSFHDYYDNAAAYGVDTETRYLRYPKLHEFPEDLGGLVPLNKYGHVDTSNASTDYGGYSYRYWTSIKPDHLSHNEANDLLRANRLKPVRSTAIVVAGIGGKVYRGMSIQTNEDSLNPEITTLWHPEHAVRWARKQGKGYEHWCNLKDWAWLLPEPLDGIAFQREYRWPVFYAHLRRYPDKPNGYRGDMYWEVTSDHRLQGTGLERVLSPYEAYGTIEQFVSGVMSIPEASDITLTEAEQVQRFGLHPTHAFRTLK